MKKLFIITLAVLIGIQVASLPVFASGTVTAIPYDSMDAYAYFSSKGLINFSASGIPSNIVHAIGDTTSTIDCGGMSQPRPYSAEKTQDYKFSCRFVSGSKGIDKEDNIMTMAYPTVSGLWRYKGNYDPQAFVSFGGYKGYIYLEFLSTVQVYGDIYIAGENTPVHSNVETLLIQYVANFKGTSYFHYVFRFKSSDPYFSIDFTRFADKTVSVVPICLKPESYLTDIERQRFGLPTSTQEAINDLKAITVKKFDELIANMGGVSSSDPELKQLLASFAVNNKKYDETGKNFNNLENSFSTDMNNNLNSIDSNPKLITNSKFINSMKFVSDMYTKLVIDTPFEQILMFTATLGIALVLIGKLRNK
ncbi:hypothetical protein [Solobacterium moorei]